MRYKLFTILLLFAWIVCVFLLVSGSPLLGVSFIGKLFPAGTLVTWVGLMVLPLAFYTGFSGLRKPVSKTDNFFRRMLQVILILAGLWGIFAYLLSGNWAFTFKANSDGFAGSGLASRLFWKITYTTVAAEWFFILFYILSKWFTRFKKLFDKK